MKPHNRQIFFVTLIAIVWASLFFSENSNPSNLDFFDKADTAWMIVASALVLLMTPGLAFFLWRNGRKEKCNFYYASKLYFSWGYIINMGCFWL